MLKRLKLRNFKGWREADVEFRRITGFFGANSSGKSALLQFPLLLKQTMESPDRGAALALNGPFVSLGAPADVIHNHDETRALEFEIVLGLDETRIDSPSSGDGVIPPPLDLHATGAFGVEQGAFRPRKRANGHDDGFALSACVPGQAPTPVSNGGLPIQLKASFNDAMNPIRYVGPLRAPPERDCFPALRPPADVGAQGERAVAAAIAMEEADTRPCSGPRADSRPFSATVAHWLRALGLGDDFRVERIKKAEPGRNCWRATVTTAGAEVALADAGFGVAHALPIIVALQSAPDGATVILDKPDLHLHPLAQAEMADLLIDAAIRRGVQIAFESHSEHVLLRLQRRIAECRLDASDVALYCCDRNSGFSNLVRLDLDSFAHIRNWPEKFMGNAFEETALAELARLERMKAAAE